MQAISFLKHNYTLAILSGQIMLISMGVGAISPILPQYAKTFGVSITLIGLIITAFGITRLLSNIPASRMITRFGRRPILIIGCILLVVSSLAAALLDSYWGLLFSWGLQGFGASLFIIAAMVMLADVSTPSDRGRVMATFQGFQLIGAGIGPLMGGFVAQAWGYRMVFVVFTILTFLCFLISYFQTRETRINQQAPSKSGEHKLPGGSTIPVPSGFLPLLLDFSFALISLVTLGTFIMRVAAQIKHYLYWARIEWAYPQGK